MNDRLREQEGGTLARQALDRMQERNIPPTPQNYEVWLAYLLGDIPDLNAEIDALTGQGAPIDEPVCARLYETYFAKSRLEDELMRTGDDMSRELEDVQRRLEEASRNTAAYNKVLEGASGKMGGADGAQLQALVGALVDATQKMRRHNVSLEQKLIKTSHEVDHLRTNLKSVRKQALTDALTGIANRKRLDEILAQAVESCGASGAPLSLAICDIDHFKRFNDTWGHQTGDQIIRFIAQSLVRGAAKMGEVGRYGGEEFVVVMPDIELTRAAAMCETVRGTVEKKRLLRRSTNEALGSVTVSIGVATLRRGESAADLVRRADALLYQSKNDGRNRVTAETPDAAGGEARAA